MGKKELLNPDIIANDLGMSNSDMSDTIANDLGLNDFSREDFNTGSIEGRIEAEKAFDESMYKNMDKIEGLNDAEKKTILGMVKSGKHNDNQITEYIDTFRGANPIQQKYVAEGTDGKQYLADIQSPFDPNNKIVQGAQKNFGAAVEEGVQNLSASIGKAVGQGHYYLDKNGVPVPLAVGQNAPAGYTVDSVWGSDKDAQDDSRVTDISKKLFNLLPSTIEGILALPEVVQGAITGKTDTGFKVARQELESLKFKTSDEFNKGIVDTENVKKFSDLVDPNIYDFSPEKIMNTSVNVGTSLLQLFATRGALGISKAGAGANLLAGYATNLSEPLKVADDLGVTGRGKYLTAMAVTLPMALIEQKLGIEGKVFGYEANAAKKEFIKTLIKDNVVKVEGQVTKESLDKLFEETAKKSVGFFQKHAKNIGSEATEEVAQNMIMKSGQVIHDQLTKDDPEAIKYNAKLFSPQSIAEYLNDAISGAIGGAGGSIISKKQNDSVYSAIEQGPEKTNELRTQLTSSLKRGKITQDDFDRANFKINAYEQYFEATKERPVSKEDKKEIFDLTYQKENLKSSIESLEKNNPGGINDGLIANKKKQAEDITKQVNDIWAKSEAPKVPVQEAKNEIPAWKQNLSDFSKEVGNPDKTISQKLTTRDAINESVGVTPELNEASKGYRIDFKTPSLHDDAGNITIKDGVLNEPHVKEGKEGKESTVTNRKLPVYAFNDEDGNTWLFASGEQTKDEDPDTSYLIKVGADGNYEGHEEFHYEAAKKNQLTFDDIPATFDRMKLKPVATSEALKKGISVDAELEEEDVDYEDPIYEERFNTAYDTVAQGGGSVGTITSHGENLYGVNIDGNEVPFASSKGYINKDSLPPVGGNVTVEAIENVEGKHGKGLLVRNAETGEAIGFLRATEKSTRIPRQKLTLEDTQDIEIPVELTDRAQEQISKIEADQDNYELQEDELGRYYVNKKTGERYGRVSTFISGQEGGSFKGDKDLRDTAFSVGRMIDGIVKDFFNGTVKAYSEYASHVSKEDYNDIIEQLQDVKEYAEKKGYSIVTKPLILADDNNKIAGQPNLLMVDKEGNIYVYDVATKRNSRGEDFKKLFTTKYNGVSSADRSSAQVNIYADILKNKFDIDVKGVGVIPFEVNYDVTKEGKDFKISSVEQRKRIDFKRKQILKYDKQAKTNTSSEKENTGQVNSSQKAKTARTGTSKAKRKIKSPAYLKVLEFESTDPYYMALQYFIDKGNVSPQSILELYKGANEEIRNRISYIKRGAPTIDEIAHKLWENNTELSVTTQDYKNAIEDVINRFNSRSAMANAINEANDVKFSEYEQAENQLVEEAEQEEVDEDYDTYTESYEELSDEDQQSVYEDQQAFEEWYNQVLAKEEENKLDLPPDIKFQKGKQQISNKEKVSKIMSVLRKLNPKLKIEVDNSIDVAGQVAGNTILINEDYAGYDTPIHEVGHIIIDAIGYKNSVIQKAISQLKGTKLWQKTAERYPNLSEENLGKEVLAEAIGREGSKVFDSQEAKSKFSKLLDYIYYKIKQLFGFDKNIAKSLAKEILFKETSTKGVTEDVKEQKKKPRKLSREEFYKNNYKGVGIKLTSLEKQISMLEDKIGEEGLTVEDKKMYQAKLDSANKILENFEKEFKKYSFDYNKMNKFLSEDFTLENKSFNELIDIYNTISEFSDVATNEDLDEVKYRIAHILSDEQLELLKKAGVGSPTAKFEDLKNKDVLLKALSHMSEAFPELQNLSKLYDKVVSEMNTEKNEKLKKLQELAKPVIKEESDRLGVKVKDFTIGNAHKFFRWMDAGDGKFITVNQAQAISESKGQYLDYVLSLQEEYKDIQEKTAVGYEENAALKTDKGFIEALETNGFVAAIQAWSGAGENLRRIKMKYNGQDITLGEIEKKIQDEANSKKISKVVAASKSLYYNMKARKLAAKGKNEDGSRADYNSNYVLDRKGKLVNKFGIKRADDFDYSTNFHAAAVQYINDMTWTKHMQPLVPIVESIEHFNSVTGIDRSKKDNVVKWMQNWKAMHLYQEKKSSPFPALDLVMKNLRHLTSMAALAFNVPAAKMNLLIGEYNNFREGGAEAWAIGHKRLASSKKGGGKKFSTKAHNILKKYNVVSTGYDERPNVSAGKLFDAAAQGLTRLAEYTIQGSFFLGQMTNQEWSDFDTEGNYTGSNPDIAKKLEGYKKKVSDVHGKYAAKDRRNFELYEFGKFVGQFKTWVPDWWKERFGDRYVDRDGVEHYGNWRAFQYQAISDLRKDVLTKEFWTSDALKHKAMRKNLQSAMVFAALLAIRLGGDDDKKKKEAGDFLSQALGNLTFVFDPQQAAFVLKNPIAGMGTALKFVDALNSAIKAERYKADGKFGDKGDLKAPGKFAQLVPYNKLLLNDLTLDEKN